MADGTRPKQTSRRLVPSWSLSAVALASLLSCNSAPNNFVIIHLQNLPDGTKSVELSATLGGTAAKSPYTITNPLDSFFVQLDESASGHLALDIEALDADGCAKANGSAGYDLPASATEVTVSMMAVSPRKCGALPACAASTLCSINKVQNQPIYAMWASASNDIWAVGNSATMLHYDGTTWSVIAPPPGFIFDLNGIWGAAANDIWAVGQAGALLHYDGTKWSDRSSGTPTGQTLFGVWGISARDIYAAGDSLTSTSQGTVLHYNGFNWSSITDSGIGTGRLNGIWADGNGSTLVYVCGVGGLLSRYNGQTWDKISSGTTTVNLHGIWGTSDRTVFAVGDGGSIFRIRYSEGASAQWKPIGSVPTPSTLWAVRGDNNGAVYALGNNGVVLLSNAPYDTFVAQSGNTSSALFASAPTSNGLVWLGGLGGYLGFIDQRP